MAVMRLPTPIANPLYLNPTPAIATPKGTREFATLLSIQQTLRYRGMGFLDFLRSGRLEIETI